MSLRDTAWRLLLVLSLAGLGLSVYLTAVSYVTADLAFCSPHPLFSCDAVLRSPYARFAGVPVALVGTLGYASLFVVAYAALLHEEERRRPWTLAAAAQGVAGLAFGVSLTLVEVFLIHSLCPLCLASFLLIVPVVGLALHGALVRPATR